LIDHQKELAKLFRDESILGIGGDSTTPESHFFDSRYSDPKDILNTLLDAMQRVSGPLIILDSWDSIATTMEKKERLKVEQGINFVAAGRGSKIVFISENPQMTTTDYLVDAVVTLKNEIRDGNRIRKIEWNKLRGSPVPLWSTLYTLDGGRFTPIISPNILPRTNQPSSPYRSSPHRESGYSSGSRDLDDFFGGGLPRRRHILFDLGRYVAPFESFNPIASMVRMNFIANGGGSIAIPSLGLGGAELQTLCRHLPTNKVEKRFRIGQLGNSVDPPCEFELDSSSWEKSCELISQQAQEIRTGSEPCLYTVSAEVIGHLFDHDDAVRFMQRLVQRVRASEDILLSEVTFGSSLTGELDSICDMCVRLEQIEGVLVMRSIKPRSQLYAVSQDFSNGRPETRLKPLV
jgi:archaellum biogenesis ATPase FlaH